ncbi:alginate lyase family protein [Streptomyces sp. NPDC102473]|uniref:alginate lyase family protein n=1 Tax=unclassified Streptomyces TaxID=2593676 RepID=UPI00381E0C41
MRSRFLRSTLIATVGGLLAGLLALPASAAQRDAASTAADAVPASQAAPAAFTHPGVGVSRAQLDTMRSRVNAGTAPQAAAYSQMMGSRYASLSYTPHPRAVVECGSYSNPNYGCTDEREDAIAAYTHALAWYVTRNAAHATKAIQIMDAWSATLRDHTNSNAPLQTAWAASSWPKAAEIIKHVYGNWPGSGRFGTMLRDVYYPEIQNGSNSNGNWELSMTQAIIGIGVHLDDKGIYDRAVSLYRNRVPAFVYLTSDGALPRTKPGDGRDTRDEIIGYWHNQTTFVNGLAQETCRDFVHTGYGIAAMSQVAETSRVQGQDLYPEFGERIRHALGLHATYELNSPPSWLCGGSINRGLGPVTEVGYNALHNRLGNAMSNTEAYTRAGRPMGTNNLFVAWETLTQGDNVS